MKAYPAGWPLWQAVGRAGFPIGVRVKVFKDEEAGVFVALESNLPGLVAEAATMDELVQNLHSGIQDLLEEYLHQEQATAAMSLQICPA